MIGPVIEALRQGSVLLADELDASLHPALVNILVRLFQSTESNPRRAQLIFNSHDVTLMGDSGTHALGRDQIWFTEKGESGSTRLYPLTDLDPRKGEAVGRRYLAGRYGATPIVSAGQLERIVGAIASGAEE
jgi:AAA15 family ATPase/GTPase